LRLTSGPPSSSGPDTGFVRKEDEERDLYLSNIVRQLTAHTVVQKLLCPWVMVSSADELIVPFFYERTPKAALADLPAPYRPRNTKRTLLQQVVHENMETMFWQSQCRSEHGFGYPAFVEKTFRRLGDCGCLSRGFSRVRCQNCGHERLLAFSCKSKLCGSCHSRRMMDLSIHLVDQVLPKVPYRHWTMTFPRPIRFLMARDKQVLNKLMGIFIRTLFCWQRKQVKHEGFEEVYPGSVTLIQTAGSILNLHPHAHSIVMDGVFVGNKEQELLFLELVPTSRDVESILQKIIVKVERFLTRYQEEQAFYESSAYEQQLADAVQASQLSDTGSLDSLSSARQDSARAQTRQIPRCSCIAGFSLHANTDVKAKDRQGLPRQGPKVSTSH